MLERVRGGIGGNNWSVYALVICIMILLIVFFVGFLVHIFLFILLACFVFPFAIDTERRISVARRVLLWVRVSVLRGSSSEVRVEASVEM